MENEYSTKPEIVPEKSEDPLGEEVPEQNNYFFEKEWKNEKVSLKTKEFVKKYYPGVMFSEWNDWRWQIANGIRDLKNLQKIIKLTGDEIKAVDTGQYNIPFRITPYYLSLLVNEENDGPLRKTMIPNIKEKEVSFGEEKDPLSEDEHCPVSGIVHRYPDRVLFLVTSFCSAYCRYCTRARMVGNKNDNINSYEKWIKALEYIKRHKEIRDVLLSGGDPLTMSDEELEYLISEIRKIKHVEIIRIGTKVPVVLPQRITKELVKMIKKYHPVFMSIHFTHPKELTLETVKACERLSDAGIPLGSQTVLLKGVNDDATIMKSLMHKLLMARVRPYYLYQCDPIAGSAHFRTTVERGLDIIKELRGFTTGYAVPTYVIDAPGGGGKIPLLPDYYRGKDEEYVYLKNYEDLEYKYPNICSGNSERRNKC